jgi:phage FluMu gp28-like protein
MAALIPLYKYQKRWIVNKSLRKIWLSSRQIGKTFSTTLEIVLDIIDAEAKGRQTEWVILSRGERQAKEALSEVGRHAKASRIVASSIEGREISIDENKYKTLEIVFAGGSRVMALPASADTARGFSAHVFLDEFAFHVDSKAIWKALYPITTRGYKLRITSTPNGRLNKFAELWFANDSSWYRQKTSIYDAVAEGLIDIYGNPLDPAALKEGLGLDEEDTWLQEFCCEFVTGSEAWLSFDLISEAEHDEAGIPAKSGNGPIYMGLDIGRKQDRWVLWILESVNGVLWTRQAIVKQNIPFSEQQAIFDEAIARWQPKRVAIDSTGLGMEFVERNQEKYGSMRVEGINFTLAAKAELARGGRQAFQDKKIKIPMGDSALRADLHKLKREATPSGGFRFDAARDANGHADRTWAIFLGIYASNERFNVVEADFSGEVRSETNSTLMRRGFEIVSR